MTMDHSRSCMKKTVVSDTAILASGKMMEISMPQVDSEFRDIATVAFPVAEEYGRIPVITGRVTIWADDTIIPFEFPEKIFLRGISYDMMPRGKGSTGSMNVPCLPSQRYCGAKYIDYPPAGALESSDDGMTWRQGKEIEIWDPETLSGSRIEAGQTINLSPHKAMFIISNL